MKLMLTWEPNNAVRDERDKLVERFRTLGRQCPEGVTLLGRSTAADLSGGYALLEAEDPKQLAGMAYQWSDLMQMNIVPVIEDQDLSDIFSQYA